MYLVQEININWIEIWDQSHKLRKTENLFLIMTILENVYRNRTCLNHNLSCGSYKAASKLFLENASCKMQSLTCRWWRCRQNSKVSSYLNIPIWAHFQPHCIHVCRTFFRKAQETQTFSSKKLSFSLDNVTLAWRNTIPLCVVNILAKVFPPCNLQEYFLGVASKTTAKQDRSLECLCGRKARPSGCQRITIACHGRAETSIEIIH